jgi:lipopolysaccharide export system protein LptC
VVIREGDTARMRPEAVARAPALRPDRARAFDAADRHTRRVRRLRRLLPLLAIGTTLALVGLSFYNPFRAPEQTIQVDVGTLNVSGDQLTMELPRLTGFNKKNEAYNVTAKAATQRLTAPGLIDLTELDAQITMADKNTATLKAKTGRFDSATEILTLSESVTVGSSRGYSAAMTSAVVNFKAGTVVSDQPVSLKLENGTVNGGRMSIAEGGNTIRFDGGVTTRFETRAVKGAPTELPPPETAGSPQTQGSTP